MTTAERTTVCTYCRLDSGAHLLGCPTRPEARPQDVARWQKGFAHGLGDNFIHPARYIGYPRSFIIGYQAGRDELDALVVSEANARDRYGEQG